MALRVFSCRDCGHRMRMAGNHCGNCYAEKSTFQKPGLYYLLIVLLIVLAIVLFLRFLLS